MSEPIDNEQLDKNKKVLEVEKLEKELIKINHETIEIRWKKYSAWGPTIIAICSLIFVWANGFLDAKSALVKAEMLNLEGKRDALNIIIKKLNSEKDSLSNILFSYVSQIKRQEEEIKKSEKLIDNLGSKIINYHKEISRKEIEIGELRNEKIGLVFEKTKIEDCLIKAKEFLKYCIRYNDYEPELNNQEYLIRGYKPPYKTRFSLSLEEFAKLNISSMTYDQFLKEVVGYKAVGQLGMGVNDYINSSDGKQSVIVKSNFGNFQMTARNSINEIRSQFECYKNLSNSQKLKLLKQMIIRP